jgi:hypothetical protein
MKPTIYVESSVVSVLVETRPKDLLLISRQLYARVWWRRRNDFELFTSKAVRDEAAMGNAKKAARRLVIVQTMAPLPISGEPQRIAAELLATGMLPAKAQVDALHWATASHHKMEYLLTWNLKHLANPVILQRVWSWAGKKGYHIPVVATPEGLLRSRYGP